MSTTITLEEAIKLVDDRMCYGRGKWSEHHKPEIDEYWQAGELAMDALKKQIPMKPKLKKSFDGWKFYACPNCEIIRHDFDSYCDNCGQAIDRSEL